MRVLVTGGAGFIGTRIVAALRAAGIDAIAFDALLPTAHGTRPETHDDTRRGDVRDGVTLAEALRDVDAVCHQAAMVGLGNGFHDAADYVSCNDLGTATLLSAMAEARISRLVLAGSMVVYGEGHYHCTQHGPVVAPPRAESDLRSGRFEPRCQRCQSALSPGLVAEDAPLDPRNVYAATKVAQEHLTSSWARTTAGRAISLRYHNVYGPGMPRDTPYAGVASFFRSALERGESPRVFEDGQQRRDFVHVDDIAAANVSAIQALDSAADGYFRPYNVASGQPHTIADMAHALAESFGGPRPRITGEYRLGDVRHITASIGRITQELHWRPAVDFSQGMKEFAHAPLRTPSD